MTVPNGWLVLPEVYHSVLAYAEHLFVAFEEWDNDLIGYRHLQNLFTAFTDDVGCLSLGLFVDVGDCHFTLETPDLLWLKGLIEPCAFVVGIDDE